MQLPMVLLDWWTLAHAILLIAIIVLFALAHRKKDRYDDDEQQTVRHLETAQPIQLTV
jgi:hypothetical protein